MYEDTYHDDVDDGKEEKDLNYVNKDNNDGDRDDVVVDNTDND